MRKIKTVKIELESKKTKEFVVKELTCQNIIDLTQTNSLFMDSEETKNSENGKEPGLKKDTGGFLENLGQFGKEMAKVMDLCCDFNLEDLKELSPSEVKEIYEAFKEVNADFLHLLEKVGITKMYAQAIQRATRTFSETLAPLLNQDTTKP